MSRVAKNPVALPKGVTATVDGGSVTIKGAKGALQLPLRAGLSLVQEGESVRVQVAERTRDSLMHAGSLRAHLANVVKGVSQGYEKKLELVASATARRRRAATSTSRSASRTRSSTRSRKASRWRRRRRPRSWLRARTSSRWARWPRRSARTVPGALQGQGRSLFR